MTSLACRRSFLAALAVASFACGGGTYEAGVYRDGEARYALASPGEGWRAVEVDSQNDLAWRSEGAGAVIQANASCDPNLDIPLEALTNHLLIGFTERELASQERRPMAGREALRTHLRAKLDGVPRELVLVVLKKDGCVYDFALVAPPGARFAAASEAYERLLASFETR
ncbi:MAG TPA: hypothetical protein RMH85_10735 [Polyangiaceae bacterium LLY-WYZ-15_(1-7)]|nr:hypothetical protein [Myxococcales bacterium]MAT25448.1 hypothetical protein [Sandaracinus sp.]HJK92543.1 hypothetical protein [Polyangiaceae bacterium LLY-WYZ-15_(1-7)]MBJ73921.1 hypothetical protein [Sandaracinus sp.]HJL00680.1 hypothetical protein [Polyangiaceae bacterium LLY-WYZ-15_(1-7)]